MIDQTRFGNLFGSFPLMEKFGYENAATFKVLPTWPFSSLFSWMDRRKRITEGESLDTALPQLATASDRWTNAVGYHTSILSSEFLSLAHLLRTCFRMCVSVWMDPCIELCNVDEFDDTQECKCILFKFFFKYLLFLYFLKI